MPSPTPAIEPDRLYRVTISKPITTADGIRLIPRAGQTIRLSGAVLEAIKDDVDSYEAA